ncbi:AF4/FMR2 family member 3-like [Thalassophryne amazonica]|uniref:AF4/FMR2 family member 3-like n=1 Tax=Thalassophryne amazonica TaxID=390379 RepID=UPI0014723FEF|nr:AF4/FMR2 family member 3-like [Thalassophryne amazonica]
MISSGSLTVIPLVLFLCQLEGTFSCNDPSPSWAPHKSMLADDLKLSSDEDDTQGVTNESASWDGNSLAVQRARTHGRRVRHSSSDSSASDSTGESGSSSLHSRSPSPDVHRDPVSPVSHVSARPPCTSKETIQQSSAQWQLDKWLKDSRKKSGRGQQDCTQTIPACPPSPRTQKTPSPARSWDSNQEYSPSQSPIPSPQLNYNHNSPLHSPGYSFCPSPSPFPSTCPSPSPSPRHSPIISPGPSICPSPCGSTRASRSPSPINKHPPRSHGSGLLPSRVCHYPQVQSCQQLNQAQPSLNVIPHRTKNRTGLAPLPNADIKSKSTNSACPQQPHQHRLKLRPAEDQDQTQSKSKDGLISNQSHKHKSRLKSNFNPNTKQLGASSITKHTSQLEQIHNNKSNRDFNQTRPAFQSGLQNSSSGEKYLVPTARETNGHCSSHSRYTSKTSSTSDTGSNTKPSLSQYPRAKSWEATAPKLVQAEQTKTSQRKPQSKEQDLDHREVHLTPTESRKPDRKEGRYRQKQQDKQERKEDRRLAEEQLLRRPWIQNSEGEEEEEAIHGQRKKEETSTEEQRRQREQQQGCEWPTVQAKQRPHTNTEQHCPQEESRHQGRTKKGGKSEENKVLQIDTSPSHIISPDPHRQSYSSSSSSSSSESESEYQLKIAKVPADSTSSRTLRKRGQQGPGRPESNRPKAVHPKGPTPGIPGEQQQSEGRQKLYTLVPFGRSEQATAPSQRGLRNLVVQFDLCLLKRVPDSTTNTTPTKNSSSLSSSSTKDKQRDTMKHQHNPETMNKDSKRKRKLENGGSHCESKRSTPYAKDLSGRTDSSSRPSETNFSTETTHNGYLEEYLDNKKPLSPLSPLSPLPNTPESTKSSSKAKNYEHHYSHSHKNKEKTKDTALKPKMEMECVKVLKQPQLLSETWGPIGHKGTMPNHEPPHHAEYYLHEAKRIKHRADAMVDKLGKAVNYVDAALSFMECGKAMEEGPLEAKSPYTMYSETVELIRYAMKLKSHSGPGVRQEDKQLAVLCFRCLALLYWQMFRLKKDHALKYSKVLLDYFKSSPKVPTTPPSWNDSGKGTGVPPSSISPSAKPPGKGSHGGSISPSLISIPHRIHQMAANHLNITNSVLYSYEYWEVADNLAKENKEFFNYLNTLSGPLTLHSSICHAVQYTRQALQWIRISAKLN